MVSEDNGVVDSLTVAGALRCDKIEIGNFGDRLMAENQLASWQ